MQYPGNHVPQNLSISITFIHLCQFQNMDLKPSLPKSWVKDKSGQEK